jgi:RHS repeat-associated protein
MIRTEHLARWTDRRVQKTFAGGMQRLYFYSANGQLLAEYDSIAAGATPSRTTAYFAGQRVGQWTDRVGSKRADSGSASQYYPYGEEITGTANDTHKFAQTYRESDSGLDYAGARYYASGTGRFLTVDRLGSSPSLEAPGGWNGYSYAQGDPANGVDPTGDVVCFVGALDCNRDNVVYYGSLCANILSFPFAPPEVLLACGIFGGSTGAHGSSSQQSTCTGKLLTSGPILFGLSTADSAIPNPNGNALGAYAISRNQPGIPGWYFGVQLVFTSSSPSLGSTVYQSAFDSYDLLLTNGQRLDGHDPIGFDTAKPAFQQVYPNLATFIDSPGLKLDIPGYGTVASGTLTQTFISAALFVLSGGQTVGCAVSWTETITVPVAGPPNIQAHVN